MLQQGNGVLPSQRSEDQPPNRHHPDEKPSKSPTRLGEEAKDIFQTAKAATVG
jgi:hypothetical protein